MEKHCIKITTLSPVCIGNGQKLSPIADFLFDANKKKIHYLNKAKIEEILGKNDALMDKYIQGIIYGMDNNKTNFNLKDFLQNQLRLTPKDYILYSVDARISSATVLSAIMRNANDRKPYIPGSTIKGAIRNALLYNYMGLNRKDFIIPLLEDIKKNNITRNNFEEKIKNINRKAEQFFIEKKIIQGKEIEYPKNKFGVTDTNLLEEEDIQVNELNRISLYSEKEIPQIFECIKKDKSMFFTLNTEDYVDENSLTIEKIFKRVNVYTQNNINIEKKIINHCTKNTNIHQNLLRQYDDYLDMVKELKENECILRIGFGKGFYFNSIGQLIYKFDETNDKSTFIKYLSLLGYNKNNDSSVFPITRNITMNEEQPLGWVKLTKK